MLYRTPQPTALRSIAYTILAARTLCNECIELRVYFWIDILTVPILLEHTRPFGPSKKPQFAIVAPGR